MSGLANYNLFRLGRSLHPQAVVFFLFVACYLFLLNTLLLYDRSTYQWDSFIYMLLAENLYANGAYSLDGFPHSFHPPGFPFLISLFMYVFRGDVILASKALMGLNALLLSVVMYKVACRVLKKRSWAMLAVFLFLLSARNQYGLFWVQPENLLAVLYTWLFYLFLLKRKWSASEWCAAPLLTAFACYLKPEPVLFAAVVCAYFLYRRWSAEWKRLVCFAVVFFLLMAPLIYHNASITGRASFSGKGGAIVQWAKMKQMGRDPFFYLADALADKTKNEYQYTFGEYHYELSRIGYQPYFPGVKEIVRRATVDVLEALYKYLGVILTLFFLCSVIFYQYTVKRFCAVFLCYVLAVCLLYFENRFIVPWLPLLYIYAVRQLIKVSFFCAKKNHFQPGTVFYLFVSFAIISSAPFLHFMSSAHHVHPCFALANHIESENKIILSNHPSFAVTMEQNKTYLVPHHLNLADLNTIQSAHKINYIIINHWRGSKDKWISASVEELKALFQQVDVMPFGKSKTLLITVGGH